MLGIYFIVQGACGLFIVFIHISKIVFDRTSSRIKHFYPEERLTIWYLIAITHLITIFCIIWFCIGHIWFIQAIVSMNETYLYWCQRSILVFSIILFIVQYIVCIWFFGHVLWVNQRTLRYLKRIIEHRLNQLPNNDKHFDKANVIII